MADVKPSVVTDLTWQDELKFAGRSGDVALTLDSASKAGPSPMQLLGFGLAGCMAMDVVHILRKGRQDLRGLTVHLVGRRAETEPRRFLAIDLRFEVTGPVPVEQVERAIRLSREKYCSVWHSMREDIALTTEVVIRG
jgi:putative redox protein